MVAKPGQACHVPAMDQHPPQPAPFRVPLAAAFERMVQPTAVPTGSVPPDTLWGFFRHHLQPVRGLVAWLFAGGLATAVLDAAIPVFIGRLAGIVASVPPEALWRDTGWELAGMAAVVLLLRPAVFALYLLLINQALNPGLINLDTLARALAHDPAKLVLLCGRLCRADRQPGDPDGAGGADGSVLGGRRGVVHRGVRRERRWRCWRGSDVWLAVAGCGVVRGIRAWCCATSRRPLAERSRAAVGGAVAC